MSISGVGGKVKVAERRRYEFTGREANEKVNKRGKEERWLEQLLFPVNRSSAGPNWPPNRQAFSQKEKALMASSSNEEQLKYLSEAQRKVKEQAFYMKRAIVSVQKLRFS